MPASLAGSTRRRALAASAAIQESMLGSNELVTEEVAELQDV